MKTILILITAILLFSCDYAPRKPFIIYSKDRINCDIWHYCYYDSKGNTFTFDDVVNYDIGETLPRKKPVIVIESKIGVTKSYDKWHQNNLPGDLDTIISGVVYHDGQTKDTIIHINKMN